MNHVSEETFQMILERASNILNGFQAAPNGPTVPIFEEPSGVGDELERPKLLKEILDAPGARHL